MVYVTQLHNKVSRCWQIKLTVCVPCLVGVPGLHQQQTGTAASGSSTSPRCAFWFVPITANC